jgi:DNA mismatch endonuclease (patch repair protein)
VAGLPGRPDIVLPKFRAVIQVHGCFWHRHAGCRFCTTPASNSPFWSEKFSRTIERDRITTNQLLEAGWRVAIVWECAVDGNDVNAAARVLSDWLKGKKSFIEFPKMGKHGLDLS